MASKDMSWVHCNVCLFDMAAAKRAKRGSLLLTTCSHIVCQTCLQQNVTGPQKVKCTVCDSQCDVLSLDGQIPADFAVLFCNPVTMFQEALEIEQFQRRQNAWLIYQMQNMLAKQRDTLQKARDELVAMKQLQGKIDSLKDQLGKANQQISDLKKENELLRSGAPTPTESRSSAVRPAVIPSVLSKYQSQQMQTPQQQRVPSSSQGLGQSPFGLQPVSALQAFRQTESRNGPSTAGSRPPDSAGPTHRYPRARDLERDSLITPSSNSRSTFDLSSSRNQLQTWRKMEANPEGFRVTPISRKRSMFPSNE